MSATIDYLRKREFSMGNGQCPDCESVPESWHGHPLHMSASSIGHDADCPLAKSLYELGETPLIKGQFTSLVEFERYISESGFYGTRPKTTDGCPRYKAKCSRLNSLFDQAILNRIMVAS